jgi:hypothetical protein
MEIAVGFHSLTTTTHHPNVDLLSSVQQVTARLSARKVSVAGANRVQDPWSGTLQYMQPQIHTACIRYYNFEEILLYL